MDVAQSQESLHERGTLQDARRPWREPAPAAQGIVTLRLGAGSVARRRPHGTDCGDVTWRLTLSAAGDSGGRVGVVKLLRARGGCLGAIRISGVEGCEKPGGAAQRASNPGYPNETQGTETSQYLEERKSTETPSVAASERGPA